MPCVQEQFCGDSVVYVTGGAGFTGRHVVQALVTAGESCRCLVRDPDSAREALPDGVDLVAGQLEDGDSVPGLEGSEVVVSVSPIAACAPLVEACRQKHVDRAVFVSSAWALSSRRPPEGDAVVAGESVVEASGLSWTILRPTMIYGPGDKNVSRLRALIRRRRCIPIAGSGAASVQPVFVEDVADAVSSAVRRSITHGRTYEIAGPFPIPYSVMIDTVASFEGRSIIKLYVPIWLSLVGAGFIQEVLRRPGTVGQVSRMTESRAVTIERAQNDLAYDPRSFEVGLERSREMERAAW